MMDTSKLTLMICDRGQNSGLAMKIAPYFAKVYYSNIANPTYLQSPLSHVGKGLPGIEFVESPWPYMDKVDLVFYPDTYDGEQQAFLVRHGIPVVGSLDGQKMELNKYFHKSELLKAGIAMADTYRADGLDDLWEYVKDKPAGSCFMKSAEKERGDWETTQHISKHQTEVFLNQKRAELGNRAKDIEVLVEDKIDSDCEVGLDTPGMVNGEIPKFSSIGYEAKEKGFVACIVEDVPEVLQEIADKMKPIYKKLGYRSPYSNENRITKDGTVYPIDETCRVPRPPGILHALMYGKAYAKSLVSCSKGELPDLSDYEHKYGAQLILASGWYGSGQELHVCSVKEAEKLNLFPRNGIARDGQIYCIPCPCGKGWEENFADIIAVGKTPEEAIEKVIKAAESLNIFQMHFDKTVFDGISESIEAGERHGIIFS